MMRSISLLSLLPGAIAVLGAPGTAVATAPPAVQDPTKNVTYEGLNRNGIEVFLGIPYAQDTSGSSRFKPPVSYVPASGSVISAQSYGPACPQALGAGSFPFVVDPVTEISEDCLNLNIARPKTAGKGGCGSIGKGKGLPVMVYIHGGSFWNGQNRETDIAPDGLILQSLENGSPVIHVAMNYRLGVFGFAKSEALNSEGSENAGLRDQRLAIEWVRDNIAHFGGDPEKITIFGQSSGGLAVGLQILAYGAAEPVPFQQAICESQALEPGITGNFTRDAMEAVIDAVGCNSSSPDSEQAVECLRGLDTTTLLNASLATYSSDIAHNIGDIWLPTVDGDFLPAAPSELITQGRFAANVTTMMGWCEDDVTAFTETSISTANDTRGFISSYVPNLSSANVDSLLALYPVSEFASTPAARDSSLTPEFYRSARIFRDIIMVCQPLWYGSYLASSNHSVYFYEWNQTILDLPLSAPEYNMTGFGVIHTSEFAYVFGNLTHYNVSGLPFDPTPQDWALERRASRSWATFATTGKPGSEGASNTFKGFDTAFEGDDVRVFVVGGTNEGLSAIDGADVSNAALEEQRLRERCGFLAQPEVIKELRY